MPRTFLDEGVWFEKGTLELVDGRSFACVVFFDSNGRSIPIPKDVTLKDCNGNWITGDNILLMEKEGKYEMFYKNVLQVNFV